MGVRLLPTNQTPRTAGKLQRAGLSEGSCHTLVTPGMVVRKEMSCREGAAPLGNTHLLRRPASITRQMMRGRKKPLRQISAPPINNANIRFPGGSTSALTRAAHDTIESKTDNMR